MQTRFHEICAIWQNDNGNMFINIPKGMLVTGKIIVTKVKDKEPNVNTGEDLNAGDPADDLPF